MEGQQHGEQLKRGLKNRHIQLIALGGAIGTGLFLGSASLVVSNVLVFCLRKISRSVLVRINQADRDFRFGFDYLIVH